MGMSNDSVKIVLGGFDDVTLTLPIDWTIDPYRSSLWQHHVLTLRWLREHLSGSPPCCSELGQRVLADFFAYHRDPSTPKSPYFEDKAADHTMADRLLLFADVYVCANISTELRTHIESMTRAHFERLVHGDVYRPKTNHGLMIDKAILCASKAIRAADPDSKYASVALRRCAEQLDWLFTAEGVTREHSVSYQEYNLNICLELRDTLLKINSGPELVLRLDALLRDGQELLAHATDAEGRYLPLGDSFREHNPALLTGLRRRGLLDGRLAHALTRGREGSAGEHELIVYPDAGFAFVRRGPRPRPSCQLAMTAAWHSDVHKQADDLNFILNDERGELIVDAGYSDRRDESPIARRSRTELAHNVVVCRQRPWRTTSAGTDVRRSTRLTHLQANAELVAFRGQHARIEGAFVKRSLVLIDTSKLLVLDEIETRLAGEFQQLFHLAPGLTAKVLEGAHHVFDSSGHLRARFSSMRPSRTEVVGETTADGPICARWRDRSETEATSCLVSSMTADAGSRLLMAQLIEFGRDLSATSDAPATLECASLEGDQLTIELKHGLRHRELRVELAALAAGPVRRRLGVDGGAP